MGLSRDEFYNSLFGASPIIESMLLAAYEREEQEIWRGDLESSPHGQKWNTSFHASSFPGDDPFACGRLAVYGLMNPPPNEPIAPWLRGWFDLGKNLELDWVRRLARDGRLLSVDQTARPNEPQTAFVDAEHWLTGGTDAIVLP